ncbi:hypothetical protein E2C01_087158 [Portunus trituberculatus]|uniref:Uncharacterized protein n=1 Tax=Portunus trituberculatus TaxID=210409 RepID=A0A5B7JDB4_PORTR|nr:hypothetical protein [Portunus trituberculatus]
MSVCVWVGRGAGDAGSLSCISSARQAHHIPAAFTPQGAATCDPVDCCTTSRHNQPPSQVEHLLTSPPALPASRSSPVMNRPCIKLH